MYIITQNFYIPFHTLGKTVPLKPKLAQCDILEAHKHYTNEHQNCELWLQLQYKCTEFLSDWQVQFLDCLQTAIANPLHPYKIMV
jgi:hypothetical protein